MNTPSRALPSLRTELARRMAWISAGWLLAVVLTVTWGVQRQIDALMDDALREAAEVLYGLVALAESIPGLNEQQLLPAPAHEEAIVWQIVDGQGKLLRRSHRAPEQAFSAQAQLGFFNPTGAWRAYGMALASGTSTLYVAQAVHNRSATQIEAMAYLGLLVLLVSAFWAWLMRRRVASTLSPLIDLARAVAAYDPLQPRTSLPAATREETAVVRDAIDELGQRLARRVASEQAFAAHAAHALRTPLAGMDAQLALAMQEAQTSTRPRLERARDAVERLKRVVQSLLGFFRSQAGVAVAWCPLDELVARVPVHGLQVHTQAGAGLAADPNLLSAVLANLLDNAVVHGAHQAWVGVAPHGDTPALVVEDDGPGLPAAQLAVLQAALQSGDPSQQAGLGLGLKLVALVAHAHGGRVQLQARSPDGRGLRVTVDLAAEPSPA
jgi:two-component system OmpR family sensor kinase